MSRNDKIAAIILGAAATVAIIQYLRMSDEEKSRLFNKIKDRTHELLSNAEETVDRVNNFLSQYDDQPGNAWIDRLYILKKMFKDLYHSEETA